MKYIIVILPFFISLAGFSQDNILIEKGRLVWLVSKVDEVSVLKKRIGIKDSIITKLEDRILVKDQIIDSYKRDSVSLNSIIRNKDTEISLKDEQIKKYKSNQNKLKGQNLLLKVAVGVAGIFLLISMTSP